MPVKFKRLLYDPIAVKCSNIYTIVVSINARKYTATSSHTQRTPTCFGQPRGQRLAENAVFGVKRLLFLYRQRISAASNSVNIDIEVCCEAQQINRIKFTGNVDGAERNRIDRNTGGTVMLIRKTGQQIEKKKSI